MMTGLMSSVVKRHGDLVLVALPRGTEHGGAVFLEFPQVGARSCRASGMVARSSLSLALMGWPLRLVRRLMNSFQQGLELFIEFSGGKRGGVQGDFLEASVIGPIERQGGIEPADFVAGAENVVESGAAEKGFLNGEFDELAGLEFFEDLGAVVAELEFVENGGWRRGFGLRGGDGSS